MDNLRAMAQPENLFRCHYLNRLVKAVGLELRPDETSHFILSSHFTKTVNFIIILPA
jgi:hypothetical protein